MCGRSNTRAAGPECEYSDAPPTTSDDSELQLGSEVYTERESDYGLAHDKYDSSDIGDDESESDDSDSEGSDGSFE